MKGIKVSLPKRTKRVWAAVILALVALLVIGGGAVAAMVITHNGTVTVVSSGGGGTAAYTFAVYDAATGGTEIANGNSAFWDLGSVNVDSYVEKTVYIGRTGTATVTVTPAVQGLGSGAITFTPTSVALTNSTRQSVVARFTAGSSAASADAFTVTFSGSP